MYFVKQDVTTVDFGVVAHGVNCQHVMGSGVALAIRNVWPEAYNAYMKAPGGAEMLGTAYVEQIDSLLYVANCYTQEFFGGDGRQYASLDAVRSSLEHVFEFANSTKMPVYMPRIGCGLGGLKWPDVEGVILALEAKFPDVEVTICDI